MGKNSNLVYLTQEEKEAIFKFKTNLIKELKDNFLFIKLFGSRASGKADKYSDIDIIVVVKELDKKTDNIISDFSFDLHMRCETPIDIWIDSVQDFQQLTKEQWPFYINIKKQGIEI